MKKTPILLFGIIFIGTALMPSADAFLSFKKKHKEVSRAPAGVVISESREARILFFASGAEEDRKDADGKKQKWVEISYKLVNLSDDVAPLFGSEDGWAAVEFLDREDFVAAADQVPFGQLSRKREYYGFTWMPKARQRGIVKARARRLKAEEIPAAQRKLQKKAEIQAEAEKMKDAPPAAEAAPVPEIPAGTPAIAPSAPPSPESAVVPEPSPSAVAAASPSPLPSPAVVEEPEAPPVPFERGGVTNEQVAQVLETQEKTPGTKIEESPSTIVSPPAQES